MTLLEEAKRKAVINHLVELSTTPVVVIPRDAWLPVILRSLPSLHMDGTYRVYYRDNSWRVFVVFPPELMDLSTAALQEKVHAFKRDLENAIFVGKVALDVIADVTKGGE
jgi:hypothetical protein